MPKKSTPAPTPEELQAQAHTALKDAMKHPLDDVTTEQLKGRTQWVETLQVTYDNRPFLYSEKGGLIVSLKFVDNAHELIYWRALDSSLGPNQQWGYGMRRDTAVHDRVGPLIIRRCSVDELVIAYGYGTLAHAFTALSDLRTRVLTSL